MIHTKMERIPGAVFTKEICEQLPTETLANLVRTNKYYYDLCSRILDERKEEQLEKISEDILFMSLDEVYDIYKGNFTESDIDYFFTLYNNHNKTIMESGLRFTNYFKYIGNPHDFYIVEKQGRSGKSKKYIGKINTIEAMYEFLKYTGALVDLFNNTFNKLRTTQYGFSQPYRTYPSPTLRDVITDIVGRIDTHNDRRLKFYLEKEN